MCEASGTNMMMGCTWLADGIALQKAPRQGVSVPKEVEIVEASKTRYILV